MDGAEAEIDALISAYSPHPADPVALAVSGGSDSMALMHIVARWAVKPRRKICVLTVDHQLRPEAATEARIVAEVAAALGLDHQILTWASPRAGQAAARDARHRLLAEATWLLGAKTLLLGHTFDDLIETILIRKRRNAPRTLLAGPMPAAPSPVWPQGRNLTLIRPLLNIRRQALKDELQSRDLSWVDDPTNDNPAYERVRVRQFLSRHPRLASMMGPIATALLAQRETYDAQLGQALLDTRTVQVEASGLIQVDLTRIDPPITPRMIAILLRIAGGHNLPPRAEAVGELIAALQQPGERRTLAGAWVQRSKTGLLIGRDPGEVRGERSPNIWDGRYVRDDNAALPDEMPILLREARPPGSDWRSVIGERIAHEARAYQTLRVSPVHK
ncbi:MAG: tRNA lysidine(34) synthetase TilS [Henriciella sp.]|nr:tRNA lysidine(34) synthetase TilS [Henriciella sp.]